MNHTQPRRRSMPVAGLVLALMLVAAPASAHVTANPGEARAASYQVVTFRVPHGCDASPTTSLKIQIPDGVVSVKPELVPGWEVTTEVGEFDEPVELHGEMVTEGVKTVTFAGGPPIPDDRYFDFGISMRLPEKAGETLYFPTIQTCEQGEVAWIQIPAEGDSGEEFEEPAPSVQLLAAEGRHGSAAATADGDITATAAAGRAPGGAGGLTIFALVVALLALAAAVGAFVTARQSRTR